MKVLSLYDPKNLFHELAEGNERAFARIFDLYKEKLQYIALKLLKVPAVAEEIVQDVFLSVWVNQSKFSNIDDPEAYLVVITYNRIYNQLRKTARENKLLLELVKIMEEQKFTTDDLILSKESNTIINQAIESLPPRQKIVFKLSRQQGMTHDQIATELNISPNTVKNHIVQALKHIRVHIGETVMIIAAIILK